MSNLKTWPEKIFLQVGDGIFKLPDYREFCGNEVSWCEDRVVDCEVEYVRADLVRKTREDLLKTKHEIDSLKQSIKRMRA